MAEAVVVDTMVASAWLSQCPSERKARYAPALGAERWLLPFVVIAEMRFGAEVARWGARRRRALDGLISGAGTMPPLPEVIDSYVDLRTWCVRSGHGHGARNMRLTAEWLLWHSHGTCHSPATTRSSTTWSTSPGCGRDSRGNSQIGGRGASAQLW